VSPVSIGASVSTYQGLHALRESNGTAVLSDDAEILDLQQTLGETAGVYAEASAVASLLGVGVLRDRAEIGRADTVVAVNTSTGLKDTDTTAGLLPDVPTIDSDLAELEVILEEFYDVSL
jgi:threonine synthase